MGNQTQNPGQNPNPSQRAPGQDDKSRRDTNQQDQDQNRQQRTPGSGDTEQRGMKDQDKQGTNR
jgi:hypothetical protein